MVVAEAVQRTCAWLCMAARVGEETFEDSVFPVGRKELGDRNWRHGFYSGKTEFHFWVCPNLPGHIIICLT